jgi:predicted nuclease of predicted toxin-antitoxin system
VRWLRAGGHDLLWAAEIRPGADDADWASLAEHDQRIILTNDKDFGEIIYRDRLSRCGVVLLRFDDVTVSNARARWQSVWPSIESSAAGNFVVVTESKVRIRPLPA